MKWKSQAIDGTGETFVVPANEGLGVANNAPTAAVTLGAGDSGKTIMLNAAEGFAITLPAPVAGLKYKFLVAAAFATTNFTVVTDSGDNVIQGGAIVNSVFVPAANEDTINFVATAETIGDYVVIESDGTNWLAEGVGAASGAITFTAS
jgi:hypothetical protein